LKSPQKIMNLAKSGEETYYCFKQNAQSTIGDEDFQIKGDLEPKLICNRNFIDQIRDFKAQEDVTYDEFMYAS